MRGVRNGAAAAVTGAVALCASLGAPAASADHAAVSVPHVEGPVTGGIKTGRPWYASLARPTSYGYVEEEFFISGAAGPAATPFKTRIHVIRPARPKDFNGSVVVEWANVSAGFDTYPLWSNSSEHIAREGFAYVAVSAQKAGVDALFAWDPLRYGKLDHPGDTLDLEIFSQAGLALREQRVGEPDPLGALNRPSELIATGASQSGARLRTYLTGVQAHAEVFDGFVPLVVGRAFPYGVAPTLIVTSEYEKTPPPAAGDDLVVWEVAGTSHVGYREFSHDTSVLSRELSSAGGVTAAPAIFDAFDTDQYGERGPGACANFMPMRYAHNAALSQMQRWLRTGVQPAAAPRFERAAGVLRRDQRGNVLGGVRLPPIEVPIATYNGSGERCDIFGDTIPFDPFEVKRLYPTHEGYVKAMRAAAKRARSGGYLVRADANELIARAEASTVSSGQLAR